MNDRRPYYHDRYSYDLDLFGERSLFQFINRTVMKKGRELGSLGVSCLAV
jgi:hypothetical protein